MKRISLTVATLITTWMLGTATMAVAQTAEPIHPAHVLKSGAKKVRIYSPVGQSVDLSLIDLNGNVLYQGAVTARDARGTSFNLINVPDGRYFVTITNDSFWTSQGVTVRRDLVDIDAQNTTELVKPALVAYAKNKYELVMPGVQNLSVAIYDRLNELVFSKSFDKGEVHRFDLSSLPEGSYTFVYGPSQKQFTEQVAIGE